jgi:hypothetical protein
MYVAIKIYCNRLRFKGFSIIFSKILVPILCCNKRKYFFTIIRKQINNLGILEIRIGYCTGPLDYPSYSI